MRDKLRSEAKNVMKKLLSELQNSNVENQHLEALVLKLHSQLRDSKGKKVYGYLQPNVKKTVDEIVAELAKNPVLKKIYGQWCELEQRKYETYTSAVQKFPPLEENKAFKPIMNAVIRAVLDMQYPVSEPNFDSDKLSETDITPPQNNTQSFAQNAIFNMLGAFGRLISDDYNREFRGQKLRTEHKLKAAIRRKKAALGLKENPLENPVFKE